MMSRIAAIVTTDRRLADTLVEAFCTGLRHAGRDVQGLIQQRTDEGTVLLDLLTGTRHPLFQNLGAGSAACSVDSASVAAASIALRRALETQADLAIANRFGPLEAGGGGLLAEMLALMAEGIPFLTIVAEDQLPAWRHFTGGAGVELPAERTALDAWFAATDRNRP